MNGRIPIIPTIFVLAAAATMVALGVWQLSRADEKAALIAQFEAAATEASPVPFPTDETGEGQWFRRSQVDCTKVLSVGPVSGTAANGAKGWTIRATCENGAGRAPVLVDLGFTQTLGEEDWSRYVGRVTGMVAPGPRLVADPPVDGLFALARPDPSDLPNNHLSYAGQWFFFALTALVIYFIALRARMAKRD